MKIAVITDIHAGKTNQSIFGPGFLSDNCDRAIDILPQVIEFVNHHQPDITLQLGDIVSPKNHEDDLEITRTVFSRFKACQSKVISLIGNHDLDFVSWEEIVAAGKDNGLEISMYGSETINKYQFHWFNHYHQSDGDYISEESVAQWLANIDKEKQQIIMSHFPLIAVDLTNIHFFGAHQEMAYPKNSIESQIRSANIPTMVLSGHLHVINYLREQNIISCVLPSFTQSMQLHELATVHPQTYSIIDISENQTKLEVYSGEFIVSRQVIDLS